MMNDILHDKEMDELLDNCFETSGGIFNQIVTSDHEPPSTNKIYQDLPEPQVSQMGSELQVYRNNLKELTGNDDHDIDRKEYFTDKLFTDMLEYMLEDTMFNLMEEATYEEFDLMQAPKIYIRKDQIDKKWWIRKKEKEIEKSVTVGTVKLTFNLMELQNVNKDS